MSDGVQLVKENLGLSAFVGRYTKLVRKGGRLAACCPIHKEKTPSFYVDDNKGYFHCFGCGKGGDLIKFCMEVEGLEFLDALEFLAEIAGVELPKRGKRGPGREVIEKLRELNEEAVNFYQTMLAKNPAARTYLKERGISESTARLFRLGLAPPQWDGLYNHLANKVDPALMMKAGLFKKGRTGKPYDLFRDRIIFPIRDVYGHTVAFGGRLYGDIEGPKYINSPETPLYVKGKHVYNLDFAKTFLKKKPEAGVLVVEGYMDVIQLYQAGFTNVIAGLGTAFTPEQGKLLKRFSKKVLLNYDGDAAGFKAARAAIEIFLPMDLDIKVITLPDKMDPDDYIKERGKEAYAEALSGADDFFAYLFRFLGEGKDLSSDPRLRSQVARELVGVVDRIEDPVVHEHYMEKTAESLQVPLHVLDQLHPSKKKGKSPKPPNKTRAQAPPRQAPKKPKPQVPPPPLAQSYGPMDSGPPPQSYGPVETGPPPQSYGPADSESAPKVDGSSPASVAKDSGPPPQDYGPSPEMSGPPMASYDDHMMPDDFGIPVDEFGNPIDYGMSDDFGQHESNHAQPSPPRQESPPPFRKEKQWKGRGGKKPWKKKPWRKGRDWDEPTEPDIAPTTEETFNKMEQEFLYHVMHRPNFSEAVAGEHREILPKILANVFADRRWVLDFIYTTDFNDFGERLEVVPETHRSPLARIHFSEEFNEEDSARLDQLCPDLLKAMLNKMADINRQRMRMLPPSEHERRKALMKQNQELRRQASKL